MTERFEMIARFDVTPPQALALQEMFKFWNQLASLGGSRYVAFYVDGDGNFKPNVRTAIPEGQVMPDVDASVAKVEPKSHYPLDVHYFDFDPVAWSIPDRVEVGLDHDGCDGG